MSGLAVVGNACPKLITLTLAHALGTLSIAAVMALGPAIQADLVLSQTQLGALVSAYYASQFILAIPVGCFIDRIGVPSALILSHLIAAGALAILSLADGLVEAAAALSVLGASYSLLNPATSKGVFDWIPIGQRGMAMGIKQAGVPLGGLFAAAAVAIAVSLDLGWRTIIQGVAGLIACGVFLVGSLPTETFSGRPTYRQSPLSDARILLGNRRLHLLGLVNGIFNIGQIGLWSHVTLFLKEALQASTPIASLGFGVVQGFSALGRVGWGRLSDRRFEGRRWPVAVIVGGLAVLGFLALAMPIGLILALAVIASLGLTIGGYAGLLQTMAVETVEPQYAASAIGYNMLLVPAGAMVAPVLVGAVVDMTGSFAAGWLLLAALVSGGVVILFAAKK